MKSIPIWKNKKIVDHAIVDDDVFVSLSKFRWNLSGYGYAMRSGDVYMHKEILSADGLETDHVNGDRLDNRKENLRTCTRRENNRNFRISKRNKSGFKGVSWEKKLGKWRLRFVCGGKNIMSRVFVTKTEAAKMYNVLAKKYYGKFAKLNPV